MTPTVEPFEVIEAPVLDVLAERSAPLIVAANDPPWSGISARLPQTVVLGAVVPAWDMDTRHLADVAAGLRRDLDPDLLEAATVVGVGGGTALDTAKYLSWTLSRPLLQVPTIASVDAGFTDAIGVRDGGRVRYVATIRPDAVVVDIPLIRTAPARLNRAGIGDILSCHTGLYDWQLAAGRGDGPAWDDGLAGLGRRLLTELDAAADDVGAVTESGVRFLLDAYRRIGAACAAARHSRFEEGSEHFWAYAYEHATGAHHVHGELICFAVCALAHVQGNDPGWAASVVGRARARAHPAELGIAHDEFVRSLVGLADYAADEGLDRSVVDYRAIGRSEADAAWSFVGSLPRTDR